MPSVPTSAHDCRPLFRVITRSPHATRDSPLTPPHTHSSVFVDLEHVLATDHFGKQRVAFLSEPVHLFDFAFTSEAELPPPRREVSVKAIATADGVLNCVTWWYELDLGDGVDSINLAPNLQSPRAIDFRARRQRLCYLGYERRLRAGEGVRLVASHDDSRLEVEAPLGPSEKARGAAAGQIVRWPLVNALAYHFPMIADEGRNGAFDRAIVAAVGRFRDAHAGRAPRVLDIGSGSGLLALMAARAGASEVHSLEMVPALAAAARHIVAANGYANRVSIHGMMSTELDPSAVGGAFDILVCEIVDDQLLGEGALLTIDDARRRLLADGAAIIPAGAVVYAQPLELRVCERAGFSLDDFNLFATDAALAPKAHTGCKLQQQPLATQKRLSPPLSLFEFDFASGDLRRYAAGRARNDLQIVVERTGVLSSILIYFTLRCDADAGNDFHSGPANPKLVAWDQSQRSMPIEMRVRAGDRLSLHAEHNHECVRVGLPNIHPEMVRGMVGHTEILRHSAPPEPLP